MVEDIKERFFYYRDQGNRPLVTVAMVRTAAGVVGYGWSICGKMDAPCYGKLKVYKEVPSVRGEWWVAGGRSLAYGRAMAALSRGVQISPGVWRYMRPIARLEALQVIEACNANGLLALVWHNTPTALPQSMQPGETQG